jgi:predicted RNA methylase
MQRVPSSKYSTLQEYQVPQTKIIFLSILKPTECQERVIVDATAHIGGDTIALSQIYPGVNILAIDNDIGAIECLRTNLSTFAPKANVDVIHEDCVSYLSKNNIKADLYYFDPPWGGPSYTEKARVSLFLSEQPIESIINDILSRKLTSHIVLKAPRNFAYGDFKCAVHGTTELFLVRKTQKGQGKVAYYLIHVTP